MKPLALEPGAGELTLTARQAMVLSWIRWHIAAHQRPPTTREIAKHFGWKGTSGAWSHIKALERKGRLARAAPTTTQVVPNVVRSRSMQVVGAQLEWREDGEPSRAELLHEIDALKATKPPATCVDLRHVCGGCGFKWPERSAYDELTMKVAHAEGALRFYADPETWRHPMQKEMANEEDEPLSDAEDDEGQRARDALESGRF